MRGRDHVGAARADAESPRVDVRQATTEPRPRMAAVRGDEYAQIGRHDHLALDEHDVVGGLVGQVAGDVFHEFPPFHDSKT